MAVHGVCTALREVPHLVPALMDALSSLLPLQPQLPRKHAQALKQRAAGEGVGIILL